MLFYPVHEVDRSAHLALSDPIKGTGVHGVQPLIVEQPRGMHNSSYRGRYVEELRHGVLVRHVASGDGYVNVALCELLHRIFGAFPFGRSAGKQDMGGPCLNQPLGRVHAERSKPSRNEPRAGFGSKGAGLNGVRHKPRRFCVGRIDTKGRFGRVLSRQRQDR